MAIPEKTLEEQTVEVVANVSEDYGMQIPEQAIRRLARFLLPKIQETSKRKRNNSATGSLGNGAARRTFDEKQEHNYDESTKGGCL